MAVFNYHATIAARVHRRQLATIRERWRRIFPRPDRLAEGQARYGQRRRELAERLSMATGDLAICLDRAEGLLTDIEQLVGELNHEALLHSRQSARLPG